MSTMLQSGAAVATALRPSTRAASVRRFVGGFYLVMGGINAGLVAADPEVYRTFADGAYWSWVTRTWHDVVMAQPLAWLLLLAGGEVTLGVLLLRGGRAARVGWAGVIAFHVLLMAFGFGFWLWSLPALALLLPAAHADRPSPGPPPHEPVPRTPAALGPGGAARTPATLWSSVALAAGVLASSLYGLLATTPYRDLPEATVLSARAQDACSIAVAALLVVLVLRPVVRPAAHLARLGLLAYLLYSYLIYVTGVPMNRMFLVYVAIVGLSAAGLLSGLHDLLQHPLRSTASPRLALTTGWVLVVTAVLFAGLWLSTLLPFALGGDRPEPEGVGGTPYPIFFLDLALVLPALAAVGVLLLRRRPAGPSLAAVAMLKILTLFTALWAGPVVALVSGTEVHLGPDAGPSLVLLAASAWLSALWLRSFHTERSPS